LTQVSVFFQPGDLPEAVQLVQFDNKNPVFALKLGESPDGTANLSFAVQSGNVQGGLDYGVVTLLYFKDLGMLQKASQWLIQEDEPVRQPTPEAGIGESALLFLAEQPGEGTALDFQVCHAVVQIRLFIDDPTVILRYSGRLAERLQRLDCQGSSSIPLLTPPPPLPVPTATPLIPPSSLPVPTATPSIPITLGYTQVQRLPDPDGATSLRAFAFADPGHGWLALGTRILATADGGKTWQPQVTADGKVEQMRFESAQTAWIMTDNGYLVTQNGGSTWQKSDSQPADAHTSMPPPPITLPPSPPDQPQLFTFCPDTAPFAGIFTSVDARTGWAFCTEGPEAHFGSTALFQTRDGGQTWQLLTDQAPYGRFGASNLFFLDEQHGWLAVQTDVGASLYATVDGGKTWQPVAINQGAGAPGNARSVHFLSLQVGFVILSNSSYNQGRDVLLGTRDGGITWQELFDAPAPAPWPDGPFQIFADGRGIGFEQDEGLAPEDTPLITTDWGKTWTASGDLIHVSGCDFLYESITSLSFPDPAHGWASLSCGPSPSTSILQTENGGKTWSEVSAPADSSSGFVGISFPNASTGYLVSLAGMLYRTTDAGRSFSPVDQQALHTRSLQFATPLLGWEVCGTTLFETTDGGSTWLPVPFPLPVQYFALLPDNSAWVVAGQTTIDNGMPPRRLFTTSDGGRSWTELPFGELPSNYNYLWLDSLRFTDDLHGWLRGGSALFFTQDGGKNWTQVH